MRRGSCWGWCEPHAQRHRELLNQEWERTDWTRAQADQILGRIDGVLELLPRAQKQAPDAAPVIRF